VTNPLELIFRPPAMPHVSEPWWMHLSGEAQVMLKDAYNAVFWAGVGQTLPYILIFAVAGFLAGYHLGQNGRLAQLLGRLSEPRP
jgi:hypothetical protein